MLRDGMLSDATIRVTRRCGGVSAFSFPSVRPYNFADRDLNDGRRLAGVCVSASRHDPRCL